MPNSFQANYIDNYYKNSISFSASELFPVFREKSKQTRLANFDLIIMFTTDFKELLNFG